MYPDFGYPPQTILLQRLALSLATGMLLIEHVMPVLGLNTSADLRRDDEDDDDLPPTIKIPEKRNLVIKNLQYNAIMSKIIGKIFCFYFEFISNVTFSRADVSLRLK